MDRRLDATDQGNREVGPYDSLVTSDDDSRKGLLLGISAYAMWGSFPLYFPLLEPAGAFEILAHRILWSMLTVGVLVITLRRGSQVMALVRNQRVRRLLIAAAVVIAINWVGFIWGVNNDRVIEVSLGYFVNPLVTVLLGVLILGERLRPLQWAAVGLAAVAVVVLTVNYGRPPWIALLLAFSFGTYGLMKKKANAGAVESLTVETLLLSPVALGYLIWLAAHGDLAFGTEGIGNMLLLASTGLVTALPLLCFSAAATRLNLVTIGLLQYLTPTVQFTLGVLWFHEPMPTVRWVGFVLVWVALAIFTTEAIVHARRRQLAMYVDGSSAH